MQRLACFKCQFMIHVFTTKETHARDDFPTPGGPKTSVTWPRSIPPDRRWSAGESSRASSRRASPVGIGFLRAADAFNDCEADMEITGT